MMGGLGRMDNVLKILEGKLKTTKSFTASWFVYF